MTDAGGYTPFSGLPASDEGVTLRIERLDDTSFALELDGLTQDPYTTGGTFAALGDIVAFQLTHIGVIGAMSTFWNSFHVSTAPEPGASAAGAALAALFALARRRRR